MLYSEIIELCPVTYTLIYQGKISVDSDTVRTQTSLAPVCSIYETIIDSKLLSIGELLVWYLYLLWYILKRNNMS